MGIKIDLSSEGGLKLSGKMVFEYLRLCVCTHAGHVQLVCHTGAGTAGKCGTDPAKSGQQTLNAVSFRIFVCIQTDPGKVRLPL